MLTSYRWIRGLIGPGLMLLLFSAGCEHADPLSDMLPDEEVVSFATLQTNIFNLNCALSGCHTGTFPPQGLNLSAGQAYASLVGVTAQESPDLLRVKPDDPDNSYLFLKITGSSRINGQRMPLGRTALSAEQIDLVRRWIEQGAKNN